MNGQNLFRAAFSYLYINDFEQALAAFKRAIELEPDNVLYLFHASVTAYRSRKFNDATGFADRILELEPAQPLYRSHRERIEAAIQFERVQELLKDGSVEEANFLLTRVLELDPLHDEAERLQILLMEGLTSL